MKERNMFYITAITLVATLGGLLFGYDTAVISGAEKSVQNYLITPLGLGSLAHGATISSALIGCIIGGILSGWLASRLGRKRSLMVAAVLFFLSALGSGFPEFLFFQKGEPTMGLLLMFNFYRVIGGIGVGLASAVCPMYIGEIAPADIRGRLVSINQFAIIFGMLVVYFVNYGIARGQSLDYINETGWRMMFLSEAIPAGLFGLLLFFVPETPRYLALTNRGDKALSILTRINGATQARLIFNDIKHSVEAASGKLFSYGKVVILIGILLSVFQQFVGINVALYYAPRIFESMGAAKDASMLQTVVMGLVNVIFTVIAIVTVDKYGRKVLLMIGSIGMAVGMFAIGGLAFFKVIVISTLVFIIIYTASFMMSWGPITWVLISEIFPNRVRGTAMSIAVGALWIACFLLTYTFPIFKTLLGVSYTFWIYAAICATGFAVLWLRLPETKGKSLEQIERELVDRSGREADS